MRPDPLIVLQARVQARVRLARSGFYPSVDDMVMPLYEFAQRNKISTDLVDEMILAELG